jgi:hypothetical protein
MNQRRSTRRSVLTALIGGAAVLAGSRVRLVAAEQIKVDDYDSKAAFKKDCEDVTNAEFIDSPKDKLTICVYPDGDKKVCDQKGKNCTLIKSSAGVPGSRNPFGGVGGGVATTDVGEPDREPPAGNDTVAGGGEPGTRRRRNSKHRGHGKRRKS